MAVDTRLLTRLEKKLNIGRRQVYNRIAGRSKDLLLSPEQAAIALALEVGASVSGIATPEDYAAVRGAAANRAPRPDTLEATVPRDTPSRVATRKATTKKVTKTAPKRKEKGTRVMVVHGRDASRKTSMFRLLRALKLDPIEWSAAVKATKNPAPYIGQVLDQVFKDAVAVVVLLTPDDQARLKKTLRKKSDPPYESTLTGQARPNVLFEAGMAFGRHPNSTILVEVGDLRPFSDIGGRHVVKLDNRPESRKELANRLEVAGCRVNTDGDDWLSEGNFA